jgi:lipoprotein signal peptidase
VTDFIDPKWYPSFNVADSAIVCGVIALIALSFFDNSLEAERSDS